MNEIPDPLECEGCAEAIRNCQKVVATTEGIDRARALFDLGMAAMFGLRLDLALASFGACQDLLTPGEFHDLEFHALFGESCVLAEMDRYEEAMESIFAATVIADEEGDLEQLALCAWREGEYLAELGRMDEALERIKQARDWYLELLDPQTAALCEFDLANMTAPPKRVRKPKSSRRNDTRRPRRRS